MKTINLIEGLTNMNVIRIFIADYGHNEGLERAETYFVRTNEAKKPKEKKWYDYPYAELGEVKVVCRDIFCKTSFDPVASDGICPECEGVY
jgi:hypothetical protein|tara:strand:- start:887 stop:1159 length:273 start_codon:yes stop_codon:yes gene_type:complete